MGIKNFFKSSENRYIIYATVFAVVYFFVIMPFLQSSLSGSNLLVQFLVFNLGVLVICTIYLKSKSLDAKLNPIKALEYMLVVEAISIWMPDYHVGFLTGVLTTGGIAGVSTMDYVFGSIATNYLHLSGILVSIFTYVITPAGLLYLAKIISKQGNFVKGI